MTHLTFVSEFNSYHRMRSEALDDAENTRIFGKCANPSGHGHRYRIEVTLAAKVTEKRPYVLPRTEISRLVEEILAPKLRHRNVDEVFGPGFVSSGENLAKAIWNLIETELTTEVSLISVKVVETRKNAFVYREESKNSSRQLLI
ncbi:MAG: hypothetical protein GTO51_10390 [Candidatus Latescibacteria bacterium]|nr:hypothetical protein [Candidatus Latescibacterota bacterium]NIM66376.1 hypothetical protein [Candidatus Latescibacterota bacterium]NIO02855.1 hypothetical protein [Candidatus Latescibacterota bacterium]NIO29990.1 hypothetical protein [Candidatus Latescibacterota bacterium]NIO57605.1 hypothetical protein [Candidatus Latescibacterota bacterium]